MMEPTDPVLGFEFAQEIEADTRRDTAENRTANQELREGSQERCYETRTAGG
jgi:hypothetical protein